MGSCQWYKIKAAAFKNGGCIGAIGRRGGGEGGESVFQVPSEASDLLLRTAEYLYHVELPNFAARGTAVMPAVPVWTVSFHWSNIDPDCWFRARCYPMRMKPFFLSPSGSTLSPNQDIFENQQHIFYWQYVASYYWIVSLDCTVFLPKQHKFRKNIGWSSRTNLHGYIYFVSFHVGQMLFADNKYLLLKRITVCGVYRSL